MTVQKLLEDVERLTQTDRQATYGHPIDDFDRATQMYAPINESEVMDERLKHALRMVQVKIARLLHTPDHYDSIADIMGYMVTYTMVLEKIQEQDKATKRKQIKEKE